MPSAAAVDAHATVTVKQHGFHVKQPLQAALAEAAAAAGGPGSGSAETSLDLGALPSPGGGALSPFRREEGGARGLLSFATPNLLAALPAALGMDSPAAVASTSSVCLEPAEHAHLTTGVKRLMRSVVRGLKALQEPEAAGEGLGGTYFFSNEAGQKIAIMKPCDEEPLAPNNPKGFVGRQLGEPGLKPTVRVGEAASREVAAYLLDHDRFARVPHTVMVKMAHPVFHVQQQQQLGGSDAAGAGGETVGADASLPPCKLGSLQQFVPHDCDTSEMGASRFSVRDVQRIGILDIRLFNTDRHAGNMLVRRTRSSPSLPRMDGGGNGSALLDMHMQQYELIPIDHGFALPEALEPPYFEWQHWPQAMLPFGREELEYIAALDAKADIEMLKQEVPSLRVESLRVLEVCTTLLKECAAAGLTLSEIAAVVTRPLIGMEEEPSELERICFNARAEVEEISDSELEEAEEEALLGCRLDSKGEVDVVAMLSVEEEAVVAATPEAVSPTYSSGASSDHTAFKMSLGGSGSEASRLEDSVFSMDEDGGSRTPPRACSPDALSSRLPPSRFAAEAGKVAPFSASGSSAAAPPVTPKTAGVAVGFVSPMTGEDSLSASFDSLSLHHAGSSTMDLSSGDHHMRDHHMSLAASSGFHPAAASFAPSRSACVGGSTRVSGGGSGGSQHRATRKTRSRRKLAIGSRLLKMTAQNYPPLVEARGAGTGGPSMSALAVFRDLSEDQWERFMECVRCQVARKLCDGAWKQAAPTKAAPLMSCPRF